MVAMKSILLRWPGFFGPIKASWMLSKMLFILWAACMKAMWRNGDSVSFSLTDRQSASVATVSVLRRLITVTQTPLPPTKGL